MHKGLLPWFAFNLLLVVLGNTRLLLHVLYGQGNSVPACQTRNNVFNTAVVTLTQQHFWVGAQVPCHYRAAWCLWENRQHCRVLLSCCLGKTGRLKCCPELISCTLGVLFPCLRLWPGITVGWGWPCVSAALENGAMWSVNGNFETFFFFQLMLDRLERTKILCKMRIFAKWASSTEGGRWGWC